MVFAVYPDTTSFYQATLVHMADDGMCMVNFVDDSDEFGLTYDKAVSIQHVMLPPDGVDIA